MVLYGFRVRGMGLHMALGYLQAFSAFLLGVYPVGNIKYPKAFFCSYREFSTFLRPSVCLGGLMRVSECLGL